MKQPRGTKRRLKTREDLLTAARKVFAERGYHDASITEITEKADVGVGTFYLHFRDKDEIFHTLINEVLALLQKQVIEEIRNNQFYSLAVIISTIFKYAYTERDLFSIALSGKGIRAYTIQVEDMIAEGLTDAFKHIAEQGELQQYSLPLLARLVTGIVSQAIIWWFEEDKPAPDEMTAQVLHLLSQGLPAELFRESETDIL